jgi:hypothetical protein
MGTTIHLCQPCGHLACAACCGIYNYVENTRDALCERLAGRTRLFGLVREGRLELERYREAVRRRENHKRIYHTIYTCEFTGFLDDGHTRVGCMLHPASNMGRDLRGAGFYGVDICEGHFCPSYSKLEDHEVKTVLAAVDDWYLYGVVITDIDFLKTFFNIVQNRLGEGVDPGRVGSDPELCRAFHGFCSLKAAWPYRDTSRPRFGKYFFVGEDYGIARIDYESLGSQTSPYDAILVSLESAFKNRDELDRANLVIDSMVERFCSAYRR